MLKKEEFDLIPAGEVFRSGVIPNSPEGLFMTNDGGSLRWIAKKGYASDWAIYCHWDYHTEEWIEQSGDKVMNEHHIKRCVPCDEKVFKCYRY
jgi:hypothetical protein